MPGSFGGGKVNTGRGVGAFAVSFDRRKTPHDEDTRITANIAAIAQILMPFMSRRYPTTSATAPVCCPRLWYRRYATVLFQSPEAAAGTSSPCQAHL